MSFNINGPDNKPVIREAQSMLNDGGAGNTGYMMAGRRKKENEEEELLLNEEVDDKFVKSEDFNEKDEDEDLTFYDKIVRFLANILKFFKDIFVPNKKQDNENVDFLSLSKKIDEKDE